MATANGSIATTKPVADSDTPGANSLDGDSKRMPSQFRSELGWMWRSYWLSLLTTYGLFNVENLLRLAQPLLLGWAINDLLAGTYLGLIAFAAGHLGHLAIRIGRQMYDTRTFTSIYADRASQLVVEQRADGVEVSRVAARSTLSREFVDFLERHVPMIIRSGYSIIGALVMLIVFDPLLVLFCLAIVIPASVLNFAFGRKTLKLSRLLHDDLEHEVTIVKEANPDDVRQHFDRVARTRVKISDAEAMTVGSMELFVLGLMAAALLRYCTLPDVAAGDIFAVFRYVLMFIMALDALPMLVEQTSRLRDIGRRIRGPKRRMAV